MKRTFCDICDGLANEERVPTLCKYATWNDKSRELDKVNLLTSFSAYKKYNTEVHVMIDLCKPCQAKLLRELADKLSPQAKPVEDNKTENK